MDKIEQNMSDSEYSVKDLAREMGVSHSVLYLKVNALTKLSINDFVKSVRLKRAARLIQSRAFSVSQVSYQVGFSNPKYFSTCFKAQFGLSPSEYLSQSSSQIGHISSAR